MEDKNLRIKNKKSENKIKANNERLVTKRKNNIIEDIGTSFQLNENTITIVSSEEVKLRARYSNNAVIINVEANNDAKTTQISISGLADYKYMYEDKYSNHKSVIVDEQGIITFIQDISKKHVIYLRQQPSTYILNEAGWTPANVGTWNPKTRIATLKTQGNQTISIETDYVRLDGLQSDGSKYKIDGSVNTLTTGILINGQQNITLSNFEIVNCDYAIDVENSDNITISKCIFSNCDPYTIYLEDDRDISIIQNIFTNTLAIANMTGIGIYNYNNYINIQKNTFTNLVYGIYFYEYNNFVNIISNTIELTGSNSNEFYGIYFGNSYNNHNLIEKNTITASNNNISSTASINFYGIYTNSDYYNSFNSILNNSITISNNIIQNITNAVNNYIYGIYLYDYESGNTIAKNNIIAIENNTISGISNLDEIYGVYFGYEDNGAYVFEYNKIYLRNNVISSQQATMTVNITGLYIDIYNGGFKVNNNVIDISNNSTPVNNTTTVIANVKGINSYQYQDGNFFENNTINIQSNNMVGNVLYYGMYFDENNNGNLIKNNIIKLLNNSSNYSTREIYGMYFYYENYANKVIANTISNNQGTAICLYEDNYGFLIEKNKLSDNDEYGIYLSDGNTQNIIRANYINYNISSGVYLETSNDSNDVTDNQITNNRKGGVYIYSNNNNNRILGNAILNNQNDGIYLNINNDENKIQYNKIQGNTEYGVYIDATNNNNYINNNNIIRNTKGMYIGETSTGNSSKYNNFNNGYGNNAFNYNILNTFYNNYWSDWNGIIPYNVNGAIDTNPSINPINNNRQVYEENYESIQEQNFPYRQCNQKTGKYDKYYKCLKFENCKCDKK